MAIQSKGHYENGNFYYERLPDMPAGRIHFTITFHGIDEATPNKSELQKHKKAFEEFFSAMAAIDDEPITDEMMANLPRYRVNFRRELD